MRLQLFYPKISWITVLFQEWVDWVLSFRFFLRSTWYTVYTWMNTRAVYTKQKPFKHFQPLLFFSNTCMRIFVLTWLFGILLMCLYDHSSHNCTVKMKMQGKRWSWFETRKAYTGRTVKKHKRHRKVRMKERTAGQRASALFVMCSIVQYRLALGQRNEPC